MARPLDMHLQAQAIEISFQKPVSTHDQGCLPQLLHATGSKIRIKQLQWNNQETQPSRLFPACARPTQAYSPTMYRNHPPESNNYYAQPLTRSVFSRPKLLLRLP